MKYLKMYEGKNGYYVVIEMSGNIPDSIKLFSNKKSRDNYLINSIHVFYMDREKSKDDYSCSDMFDADDLVNFWNEEHGEDGDETYYEFVQVSDNVELLPELELKVSAKKYNL